MHVRLRHHRTKDLDSGKAKARAGPIERSHEFLGIIFHTGKFMVAAGVQIDARRRGIGSYPNLRRRCASFQKRTIRVLVELLASGGGTHRESASAESELFVAGEVRLRITSNGTYRSWYSNRTRCA